MDNNEKHINDAKKSVNDLIGNIGNLMKSVNLMMPATEVKTTEINGVAVKAFLDTNNLMKVEFVNPDEAKPFFKDLGKKKKYTFKEKIKILFS